MRSLVVLLLALAFLVACTDSGPDQHYERALGIERQLLRDHPDIDYGHPGYLAVLRELAKVPSTAAEAGRARKLASRISDGRRFAARDAYPQIDHLPNRLAATEAPVPARAAKAAPAPRRAAPAPAGKRSDLGELTDQQKQSLGITMYSTAWCGYCRKARRWFEANGLPFVEKDVEKDSAAGREFRELTGGRGGVPVIVVGDEVLRGFSKAHVQAAVERRARSL
ncbi:MAG: glutaredoxin family protein [Myxococcota bacterium]|nr:glutaredoxin family protein [Myxococcota bacterium]